MTEKTDQESPKDSAGIAGLGDRDVSKAKSALRRDMAAKRSETEMRAVDATSRLTSLLTGALAPSAGTIVSGYWPMRDEIDPRPTLSALAARGCRTCLPTMREIGQPLLFRAWDWGDPLITAAFGVQEPEPSAEEVEPDILLVPMLAFDRSGMRLGYGGGFYDRTLARLRGRHAVRAIGIAFAAQEVEAVPADTFDAALDGICTECEFIELAR